MRGHSHGVIKAAAQAMADTAYTADALYEKLFAIVLECTSPPPRSLRKAQRRMPVSGEVLPPEQRASWARQRTVYDSDL